MINGNVVQSIIRYVIKVMNDNLNNLKVILMKN